MITILTMKMKALQYFLYVPLLYVLLTLIFIQFIPTMKPSVIIIILQLLFTSLSFIWSVFLFYDLFISTNHEYMWRYYKGYMGKILVTFMFILVFFLIIILFFIKMEYRDFSVWPSLVLITSQIMISAVASLVIFSLSKNVAIPLSFAFIYISAELATFGQSKYLYHVFLLNLTSNYTFDSTLIVTVLNILFGLVGYKIFKLIIQ